jgi:hypothetical protein
MRLIFNRLESVRGNALVEGGQIYLWRSDKDTQILCVWPDKADAVVKTDGPKAVEAIKAKPTP